MLSHWANAHGSFAVRPRVGEATSSHPYKPLGLMAGPLPHCKETFCLSTKIWGEVDIFPQPLGLEAPNNFKPPYLPREVLNSYNQPLYCHLYFTYIRMNTSLAPFGQVLRKLCLFKPSQSWEPPQAIAVPGHCFGTAPHSNWHIS
jgi:hypothetical protein